MTIIKLILFSSLVFSASFTKFIETNISVRHYVDGANLLFIGMPSFFCAASKDYEYFCNEGYYNYAFKTQLFSRQKRYEAYIPKNNYLESAVYRGLGLSFSKIAQLEKIEQIIKKRVPQNFKAYVYDGWSFSRLIESQKKIEVIHLVLSDCGKIKDQVLKRACYFGIGRALYFLNQDINENIYSNNQYVKIGYGYANGMNKYFFWINSNIDKSILKGISYSRYYKNILSDQDSRHCVDQDLYSFLECIN